MARKLIILRTDFSVDESLRRIAELADPAQRTLFSLSGYKGSKPLLVKIDGHNVKLWKRIHYRNDFRPSFFGKLLQEPNGKTRLEGHFGLDSSVKILVGV